MANATDKIRDRMKEKATSDSKAKPSPEPPKDGGSMSGERGDDIRGQGTKDKDVAAGPKSIPEKQGIAEDIIADAKARDVEDSREETSGDERHDLVIPTMPNIPPTIVQERLRNNQNPATGEPWTREEKMNFDKQTEQARQDHARAVKESEERMREERTAAATPIQPVPHVPNVFLTDAQKKAMQESQDRGEGPIAQAAARDQHHPDEIGRRQAEANQMTEQERRRREAGVSKEIEEHELGEDNDNGDEEEKGADEIERELDEVASKDEKRK